MNREILFKAQEITNRKWIVGDVETQGSASCSISNVNEKHIVVDEDSVCQYTGFRDMYGKRIWQNDIIQYHENIGIVTFQQCKVSIKWVNNESLKEDFCFWAIQRKLSIRVIGNIFDNPEIIKNNEN